MIAYFLICSVWVFNSVLRRWMSACAYIVHCMCVCWWKQVFMSVYVCGWMYLLSCFFRAGCTNVSNLSHCELTTDQRVGIYSGITGSLLLLALGRIVLLYIVLMKAARVLHNRMFQTVLRAPILFFDTNPVGESTWHCDLYAHVQLWCHSYLEIILLACCCRSSAQSIFQGHRFSGRFASIFLLRIFAGQNKKWNGRRAWNSWGYIVTRKVEAVQGNFYM